LLIDDEGAVETFAPPPRQGLPANLWRVPRASQAEAGQQADVLETLEDTPFYSRSLIRTHLLGQPATAMHESLSLDRFRSAWVRMLLPFRMPRRAAAGRPVD
jgi:carotenoid 1,2-hydratase